MAIRRRRFTFRKNARRFRRRRTTLRTRRPRTSVRALSRRVSQIRRNFQPEFKYHDYDMNTVSGVPVPESLWFVTASANLGLPGVVGSADPQPGYMSLGIPGLVAGDSGQGRDGYQVLYRHIQITGLIACIESGDAGTFAKAMTDMSGYVKIMVLLDKQARMGIDTDAVPYFLQHDVAGDYSMASRRYPYSSNRYTVLASRTYSLSMGHRPSVMVNIQIPMRRVMHYTSGDAEHQVNQRFVVIAIASPTLDVGNSTPVSPVFAMRLQARVRYVDC